MSLHFPLIVDGATGTQLQKYGFSGGCSTEQWVLEHPEAIIEIQKKYVEAGSNVVYAPTFSANRIKLSEHGLGDQVEAYNKKLVALSREAVGDRALVAGDISPTGHFLEPIGDMTFEEYVEVYTEQAKALEEAGVDLYVVETSMTLPEVRAAILSIKSVSDKPIFVTFSCDEHGRTLSGTDAAAALVVTQSMGIDGFGLNCFSDLDMLAPLLQRLQEYAEIPLIVKPNAGLPVVQDGKTVYHCTPEEFASHIPAFAEAGAMIFGGCCGTTEGHIHAIAECLSTQSICTPQPKHSDHLLCATEKSAVVLTDDTVCTEFYPCDEMLETAICEAEDSDDLIVGLKIESEECLENLAEGQYALPKPVCFTCEDASLLEQALRLYQGRALYAGNLPKEVLLPLTEKYGLII